MNEVSISVMSGKLKGIPAINTDTTSNTFCSKMQKTNAVCKVCYSQKMLSTFRKSCVPAFKRNSDALSSKVLDPRTIKVKGPLMRLHGHGELINELHFSNYVKLARFYPETRFVLWTKRVAIIKKVLEKIEKPKNLKLIFSAPVTDKVVTKLPVHFDKTFSTVSDGLDPRINCTQKCSECMLCYSDNNVSTIVEHVK